MPSIRSWAFKVCMLFHPFAQRLTNLLAAGVLAAVCRRGLLQDIGDIGEIQPSSSYTNFLDRIAFLFQ